jgi:hypothetical protein
MPGRCYAVITAAGRLCFRCSQRHRAPHRSLAGGVAPDVVERAVLMQPGYPRAMTGILKEQIGIRAVATASCA